MSDAPRRPELKRRCQHQVLENASLGPGWAGMITLSHVPAPDLAWAEGMTLHDAAMSAAADPMDFAFDVLIGTRMECSGVMAVPHERSAHDLAKIFRDPRHMGGSDGIFVGGHPHPRAAGTFARYLREYVRELSVWSWPEAADHLARGPVDRFCLGARGRVEAGCVADLILVDPESVADTATYASPRRLSVGIDDVLVSGVHVLRQGHLTGATPGVGLRRSTRRG